MSLDLTTTAFGPDAGISKVSQPAVSNPVPMAATAKNRGNVNMARSPNFEKRYHGVDSPDNV